MVYSYSAIPFISSVKFQLISSLSYSYVFIKSWTPSVTYLNTAGLQNYLK